MSAPQMPCSSTGECEKSEWCMEHQYCWRSLDMDERAYRTWHAGQMAKPFEERNFE